MMLEDVRRNMREIVEAGVAAVSGALTPARARDLARTVARGEGREQVNRVAQELLEWSGRSREWVAELVQREVRRQLSAVGIATRSDLDAIRKRVRELERGGGASAGGGATSAPTAKKSPAKKSTARKSPAKKSPAKKSTAKKSTAKKSPAASAARPSPITSTTSGSTTSGPAADPSPPAAGLGDPGPGVI